jgi:exodeoxyribonuclease VII large subunit
VADLTPQPLRNAPEFSVAELSNAIKRALEEGFGHIRLRGEVSGYRGPHSSGHCYFGLKDDKAKIDAVVWKGVWGRLKVKPEEGMEVIVTGKVSSFPGSSKYQIVIEALEPAGAGALMALLEEKKRKLAAEGLFDEARKKPLPFLPRVVGIVTSPTGAVIRDMLHGFAERFPAHVIVWPVPVQGEGSAAKVAAAIRGFNAFQPGGAIPRPDVLIVARGGGSLEDLWGFNEEIVVRAAAESRIPLISAVGHETDWTLIDLVADARAPTPTKAAEWAVPKYSELIADVADRSQRLRVASRRLIEAARTHLKAAARGLPRAEDLVALPRQRFDAAEQRLSRALLANTRAHAMRHAKVSARLAPRLLATLVERRDRRLVDGFARGRAALGRIAGERRSRFERIGGRLRIEALANRLDQKRRALEAQAKLLTSLSYQGVIARGFAIIRDDDGNMVRRSAGLTAGRALEIEFADGRTPVVVTGDAAPGARAEPRSGQDPAGDPARPSASASGSPPAPRKRGGGSSQGSLF